MERNQIIASVNLLKLYGMNAAYDEVIATAVKPSRLLNKSIAAAE